MITKDPTKLAQLVAEAEVAHNERLDKVQVREDMACGVMRDAVDSQGNLSGDRSPENLAFGLFSMLVPSMVTSSPVMRVMSSGSHLERIQAQAIQASGSQIAQKQRMQDELRPCAWDMVFKGYACAFIEKPVAAMSDMTKAERRAARGRLHADEPDDVGGEAGDVKSPRANGTPRTQTPPRWPRMKALDPRKCGWDAKGRTIAQARFTYHSVTEDHEDLLERAMEHSDDWVPENVIEMIPDRTGQSEGVDRGEVHYYVVYIPGGVLGGKEPKPNQHGTIHTISAINDQQGGIKAGLEIRRPFYWEGHPGGPHVFHGQYTTGKDSHFLSLLGANEDALAMLDAVAMSLRDRMRNHKVNYAYDAAAEEQVTRLAQAADGEFIGIPRLAEGSGALQRIETGEVSTAEVAEFQQTLESAGRNVGLDEAARGRADADTTATAVSVAANATQTRLGYLHGQWNEFVRECMERMAFEIAHDDRVAIRLNESGRERDLRTRLMPLVERLPMFTQGDVESLVERAKSEPVFFQGGDFASDDNDLNWHSLDIRIEPHSMDGEFGAREIARLNEWAQFLAFAGQQMVQQPHIRWIDIIKKAGTARGMTDAETIADVGIAQELLQMQLAQPSGQPEYGQVIDVEGSSATLRESNGGARSPSGVDPGNFQIAG